MAEKTFSGKPSLMKEINKNIVLNIVREKGPISRAKLSSITNISRPTMSNIIKILQKDGLIKKAGIGKVSKEGGKKPVLYKFNKEYGYVIGLQIRVNEIISIITNYNAEIISSIVVKIGKKRSLEQVINLLCKCIDHVIKDSKIDTEDIRGIGIGFNGIVDYRNGLLKYSSNFPQWGKDIGFARLIEEKYGVKTYIDNNCRMLVSAEKIFGLGKEYDNIIAIDTEEGIGSGIIIRDDIYRGNDFLAGEIGHTTINPDGPTCACGKKGCAEVMISTHALIEEIKKNLKNDRDSLLNKNDMEISEITLNEIFNAYVKGDPLVEKAMEKITDWFSVLISNMVLSFNPKIIIIQGDYTGATKKFTDNIKKKIRNNIMPNIDINPEVMLSELGKFAGPIGSVSLVLSQLFNFSNVWNGI